MTSLLRAGLLCRCPRCGNGRLFYGFLDVNPVCSACQLSFADHDSGDGPAVFLIFILGFILVPIALYVAMHTDWPVWVHGLLWGGITLLCTLGLLRPAKALTIALHYRHRRNGAA